MTGKVSRETRTSRRAIGRNRDPFLFGYDLMPYVLKHVLAVDEPARYGPGFYIHEPRIAGGMNCLHVRDGFPVARLGVIVGGRYGQPQT